ncbi:MAG TPA: pentapeptide repeat-containing protein [Patescibacteria group bacterium]|nr:pentapeptide repeat-containing protein [Patescibacteria group bacterium]
MDKGYKVFNPNWTCQGYQYEVGKTFEIAGKLEICSNGFHFCNKASDCFNYYSFDSKNKVAEIIAHGEVITDGNKSCTSKIEIVREIPWHELLTIVNEGSDNTGLCNTGNCNTGNWNTGNCNTGNRNTGNCNTGDWNTGNRNTGDCNTGDWNTTNFSSGVFCTEEAKALFFDKESDIKLNDWFSHDARYILNRIQTVFWCCSEDMTEQEKELHPEHEITGGFLKTVNHVEAAEKWVSELEEYEKEIIKSIPNYDAEKFFNIVGVRL